MKCALRTGTLLFASVIGALGRHPKVAPDLDAVDSKSHLNVIVRFKQAAGGAAAERTLFAPSAKHKGDLPAIRSAVFSVEARDLYLLADSPDVEFVSPDRPVAATTFSGTIDYGWMGVLGISSPTDKVADDGKGIGVAVIDSGINSHNDISLKAGNDIVVYEESFVPGDSDTDDSYGHGTHVAGIIAGNGASSQGSPTNYTIRGVAPAVRLVSLRVLDRKGTSTDSVLIAAIQKAIALKSKYNIRVINLSLGRPVFQSYQTDPLCQAVEQAWKAGIVVVVSAGDEGRNNTMGTNGYGTVSAPGNDPFVLTVGAMNTTGTLARTDDKMASYSSKGPTTVDHIVKPDLVAPGNRILSLIVDQATLEITHPENIVPASAFQAPGSNSPAYYQLSGTSMAAPMVSGSVALLLQKNSALQPNQVKAILMKSADKLGRYATTATDPTTGITYTSQNDIFTVGAGYLNVVKALANTDAFPAGKTALSPVAQRDPVTGKFRLVKDTSAVWGGSVLWGDSKVWGDQALVLGGSVLWGVSVLWGDSVIWGDRTSQGFSVLWGDSALWGDSVLWGDAAMVGASSILLNGER